jgi:hypothetical protein
MVPQKAKLSREKLMRALKHRRERNMVSNKKETTIPLGLKSRHAELFSHEEKGKCAIARLGTEFPSIGFQPEAQANQRWPDQAATLRQLVEAGTVQS